MRRFRLLTIASLVAGVLVGTLPDPSGLAAQQSPGFLFDAPRASLGFRFGVHLPRAAGGDGTQSLWDLTRENLTVETLDLSGVYLEGDLAVRLNERLDVVLTLGRSTAEAPSEFRDWVDLDDNPIEQTTEFGTTRLTIGAKAYLFDRGRSIGRFAWVPRAWNPYASITAGSVWYRFEQYGDFVDFETYDIFGDTFRSEGRAPTLTLGVGVDRSMGRRLLLTGDVRYGIASAPLEQPFVGFPDLDLAGLQCTVGFSIRL